MKRKRIAVLGSTGSVGTQTLDLIKLYPDLFEVKALVAYSNKTLLLEQQKQFNAEYVGIIDKSLYGRESGVCFGSECLENVAELDLDVILVATRGIAALRAVLKAIENGVDVALANKETLVCGGALVKEALVKSKSALLPVDSEHSAVWQCLGKGEVSRLVLTASGGPFFGFSAEKLKGVTPEMALKHPNWSMGSKITVDSATMMNKGLELIEAHWLFDMPLEQIDVVVHPQSIVHSLVEYADGTMLAQMALPDMKYAIGYALSYPERLPAFDARLDLTKIKPLEFFRYDKKNFPAVDIVREAFSLSPLMPTVLNAANDTAVGAFLQNRIGFTDICETVRKTLDYYKNRLNGIQLSIDTVYGLDDEAKRTAENFLKGK